MWGLEIKDDTAATAVYDAAIRQGLLVNRTRVIRLLPPLIITEAELDRALVLLDAAFSEVF
jgi:4-aminobutyrate aminotransferase-like enzyme